MDYGGLLEIADGEVLQTDHYYPFGMRMGGLSLSTGTENRYRYNGKEFHQEFNLGLYDYGARMYDPSIARWNGVDIQADTFLTLSPYTYVANSPLKLIDPNGEEIWVTDENGNQYQYLRGNFVNDQGEAINVKNNTFLKKTRNALRAIQYSGAVGNRLVTALSEKTESSISINYVQGGAAYLGGQIGFDPSLGLLNENGEILSPSGGLTHELGHGYGEIFENNSFRKRDATNWYMQGGDPFFSVN